ncbi:hypothetical protein JG688_00011954 [Phytophthora aleatoria]|uniref:START domain-containing protein n=1 Tax=Phytophthora aleatoria TaxID=2496075 RepID=A0A8J5IL40_9STRA|nr:hypothetical protein JG688_00011954 [Phytophthora aleatoria]
MPRKLTKQSSSSMSSYNAEGVPLSNGKPEYLELSDDVKDLLVKQISTAVEDVLDSMMHEGTKDAHWRSKMRKDDVEYYEDRESVTKGQSRFCCESATDASVEDVINLFLVSDTDMLLQRCRVMYDNLMDARILSVLEHPSEEHPMRSSYVRYTAFKTPALLRNHRDMCVVVATDVIHRPDGSTVGYCVWDSLSLPEVSEFDVPQGFIRSRMFRSGYFVQNSGEPNSETKVAYIVGIEAGGFAPRLATRYVMPRFGAVLNRVVGHLRRKQLDPSMFAPQSEWNDKHTAEFCQCCSKHFGAVKLLDTRRYNCVVCGDAICHAGSNYPKTKSQVVISPVVDDMDNYEDGDLSMGEEGNGFGTRSSASLRRHSNNAMDTTSNMHGAAVALKIHDVPEDTEYPLQRKSATNSTNDVGMLSRLGVGQFFGDRSSNQEQDTFAGPLFGQKYTVLGQKQQWRKNRAGRSRQLQTIAPVDDDSRVAEGAAYSSGRGSSIPSSSSSYYESRSSRVPSAVESFREGTSSLQSNNSSERDSDYSHGRSHCESSSAGDDNQRFVVTKQKKSKYSAKLQLDGQKPLYLGRYKNEEAALAACESAYSVISTPRK